MMPVLRSCSSWAARNSMRFFAKYLSNCAKEVYINIKMYNKTSINNWKVSLEPAAKSQTDQQKALHLLVLALELVA